MIALQQRLYEFVKTLGEAPTAAIIDDEVPDCDGKDPAWWLELREVLQRDPTLLLTVLSRMDAMGLQADGPPTAEDWRKLTAGVVITDSNIGLAVEQYLAKKRMLASLKAFLEAIGFKVVCYSTSPDIASLIDVHLCMVDYQIQPEDDAGKTAVTLLSGLLRVADSNGCQPPMVVLMSKAIRTEDTEAWDGVAAKSGYFRFTYDYLDKQEFEIDASPFSLLLLGLLAHKPLANCYYQQLRCLRDEASLIADKVMKLLLQVTPPEARVFRERMREEGKSLGDEFTTLFSEHFSLGLRESPSVQVSMGKLDAALSEGPAQPPLSPTRHALHRLYAHLLHADQSAATCTPPAFGDIYATSEGNYLLILTQECDLAIREDGKASATSVLAVEGDLKTCDRLSNTPPSIFTKPIVMCGGEALRWIWWDVKRPIVVPYVELRGSLYVKQWRLRFQDAEDVQHGFSANLTRVGLGVAPNFVTKHECRVFSERRNTFLDHKAVLHEIPHGNSSLVCLSPRESRVLYFGLGADPIMPLEKLLDVGKFGPKDAFVKKFKALGVFICDEVGGLVMRKTLSGRPPNGVKLW